VPTVNSLRLIISALCLLAGCNDSPPPAANQDLSVTDLPLPAETMLAAAQTLTTCLAVDASGVYWTDQGGGANRLLKVALGGGTPTTLAVGADAPGCVVIDSVNAYFTSGDRLMAVPLANTGTAQAIASGQHFLGQRPLYAQGGYVWWITDVYGAVDAFNGHNAIVRVKSGSSVEVMFNGVVGNPGGLAVDDANYYYSDTNGVFIQPRAGSSGLMIGTSSVHNNTFAVDSAHLAIVEIASIGTGDVAVLRLDGMGRVIVSPMLAAALTIDGSGVFARQGNRLVRFTLDGKQTLTLAEAGPRAIALDATNLYFTDGASIQKIAKPR
jgi:hypothetical protein